MDQMTFDCAYPERSHRPSLMNEERSRMRSNPLERKRIILIDAPPARRDKIVSTCLVISRSRWAAPVLASARCTGLRKAWGTRRDRKRSGIGTTVTRLLPKSLAPMPRRPQRTSAALESPWYRDGARRRGRRGGAGTYRRCIKGSWLHRADGCKCRRRTGNVKS